jgi:hypothetical protein
MSSKNQAILLNDLLRLENLSNVKIRFNKETKDGDFDPIKFFKDKDSYNRLMDGQFHNYKRNKSFKEGQIAIGFARIDGDKWLLFDISKITKDLNKFDGVGYDYEIVEKYEKYLGRIIVKYHNKSQNMVRLADGLIDNLEVVELLPEKFNDDDFPGYENVDLTWYDLKRVVNRKDWKTALENQKGVYLISDTNSGKFYVGSAYGEEMILGRWKNYIDNGHGGNIELKKIVKEKGFDYIKNNFKYSILDIYKSTTNDQIIINHESAWKNKLLSRKFGYNSN